MIIIKKCVYLEAMIYRNSYRIDIQTNKTREIFSSMNRIPRRDMFNRLIELSNCEFILTNYLYTVIVFDVIFLVSRKQ